MYCKETEKQVDKILKVLSSQLEKDKDDYLYEIQKLENSVQCRSFELSELNSMIKVITDVKKVSDKWYASCEAMVRMVDIQCLAIEEDKISHKNLKDIVEFIKYINDETSNINNDFSLSFDYQEKNDVGSLSYATSFDAIAIQKAWEMKLALHEESEEEKEERKKEEKAQLSKKKTQKAKEENEQAKWEQEVEEVERKRKEEKESAIEKIEQEYKRSKENLEKERERALDIAKRETQELVGKKNALMKEIESLGALQFLKKNSLRKEIEPLLQQINDSQRNEGKINMQYNKQFDQLSSHKFNVIQKVCNKIDDENPIPLSPAEEKAKKEKERLKNLIVKTIDKIGGGPLSEIMHGNRELGECSIQSISDLLSELLEEKRIVKCYRGTIVVFYTN